MNFMVFGVNGACSELLAKEESVLKYFLSGAISGSVACLVNTPSDCAKIRLQTGEGNYQGTFDCFKKTIIREGIRGLYHGLKITMLRDIPGFAVYFGIYGMGKDLLKGKSGETSLFKTILAGGIAGVLSWTFYYPIDVVKTNIQKDCTRKTIKQTATQLYRSGGASIFYRGLKPTVMRAFLVNATVFVLYEKVMQILESL
eukprot:TRINITY_DN1097_c0_g1_i1.p1 TRINITY_DN1097_c0_g1~~TRINITY_DN1097_c0_g1_i1.p1  ORF type:complete len:200 (-),score=29.78 TRINITY_DN1097_c0_g1_i1:71-670(-)